MIIGSTPSEAREIASRLPALSRWNDHTRAAPGVVERIDQPHDTVILFGARQTQRAAVFERMTYRSGPRNAQ